MKKFIVILLACCCLLGMLTSCETADSLVSNAINNTQTLNAYEAELKADISMSMSGVDMEIPMTTIIKIKDATTDTPTAYLKNTVEVMGSKTVTETYMDSEWVYVLQDGTGYKMSLSDVEEETGEMTETLDTFLQDMPESVYKDVEIVKNEDGTKSVTLNISDEAFQEIFSDMIDSLKETMASGVGDFNVTITDTKIKITIDGKYISVYDISFNMAMTVEGTAVTATVKEVLTITKTGDDVTVTPMSGYENYTVLNP